MTKVKTINNDELWPLEKCETRHSSTAKPNNKRLRYYTCVPSWLVLWALKSFAGRT